MSSYLDPRYAKETAAAEKLTVLKFLMRKIKNIYGV